MGEYAEVALVGSLAEAFAGEAPKATLRLLPLNGSEAAEQLERGAIDVAVAHLRAMPPAIKMTQLFRDPFVVDARKGHPITEAPVTVEGYAAWDHVLVSPRGDTSGALDRVLVDYGQRRRVALLVATYLAVRAALAASDLIATIPSRAATLIAAHAEIAILPLPVNFSATISMAWHRRSASEPAQAWFRKLLTDAAGNDWRSVS
jgi:DNA-binding transcriptional LysR family regulator